MSGREYKMPPSPHAHWNYLCRKRALQYGAPRIDWIDRDVIDKRDNSTCYICKRQLLKVYRRYDHVIPLSRGGSHTADNIRVICQSCNSRKGTKLLSEMGVEHEVL